MAEQIEIESFDKDKMIRDKMVRNTVTIIIPVHNSNGYIKKTVKSIYESTDYPFKIMLIESNSTDSSKQDCIDLSEKYKEVEVYNINVERGQQAINYGLKNSKGDVFITHDDVVIHRFEGRDWLERFVFVGQKDNVGIITGPQGGGTSGPGYVNAFKWVGTWMMFLTRRAIDKIGYFDENMKIGDDIDFSYRVKLVSLDILSIKGFYVDHHRLNDKPQDNKKADIYKKESAEYFRKKHNLNMEDNPVIIGIPVKNDLDSFKEMISSLFNTTNFFCKIVIIECDSNKETKDFINILKERPNIEVIHTTNETSLQAYNRLFQIAKERKKDLFLTQTDVVFPKMYKEDWLRFINKLSHSEGVGAVSCLGGTGVSGEDCLDNLE